LVLPLAVGALLGDALLHLLPEALRTIGNPIAVASWTLVGTVLFLALDRSLHVKDSVDLTPSNSTENRKSKIENSFDREGGEKSKAILSIGKMSIAANSVHNFVDGVLIAGTFVANPAAGAATLIAVILHEIPHEAANYGILLHANYTRERALLLNLLVGLIAMAGAVTALLIGTRSHLFIAALIPFTAGCFLYMACADLIPSILKKHNGRVPLTVPGLILTGIAIMGTLLFIEPK
jgi:zinc and cadmium transporter